MTLVVEDGNGIASAESYISLAAADARHAALGNTGWTGSDTAKEQALRRATVYMVQAYRQRWQGVRATLDQALDWPRYGVEVDGYYVAGDSVPTDVANACADLALRALTEDLSPDLERAVVREKVGPIETEYDRFSQQAKRFSAVDRTLAAYMLGGGAMRRLIRA